MVTIQEPHWRLRNRRRHIEQVKAGLQKQEQSNMGTRGMSTVRAVSLLSLLRNCSLTFQTFCMFVKGLLRQYRTPRLIYAVYDL